MELSLSHFMQLPSDQLRNYPDLKPTNYVLLMALRSDCYRRPKVIIADANKLLVETGHEELLSEHTATQLGRLITPKWAETLAEGKRNWLYRRTDLGTEVMLANYVKQLRLAAVPPKFLP